MSLYEGLFLGSPSGFEVTHLSESTGWATRLVHGGRSVAVRQPVLSEGRPDG